MGEAWHMALCSTARGCVLFKGHPLKYRLTLKSVLIYASASEFSPKCLKILFQCFTLVKPYCGLRLCHRAFSVLLFQCCSEPWEERGFFCEIELVIDQWTNVPTDLIPLQKGCHRWWLQCPHPVLGVSRAKPPQQVTLPTVLKPCSRCAVGLQPAACFSAYSLGSKTSAIFHPRGSS